VFDRKLLVSSFISRIFLLVPDGSRWFQMVAGNVNALTVNDLSRSEGFLGKRIPMGELSETNWNPKGSLRGTTWLKLINLINLQSFPSSTKYPSSLCQYPNIPKSNPISPFLLSPRLALSGIYLNRTRFLSFLVKKI
jgi:hypothetical protein